MRAISFNAQHQHELDWAPSFAIVGAYYDQAVRGGQLTGNTVNQVAQSIDQAKSLSSAVPADDRAIVAELDKAIRRLGDTAPALSAALDDLRATFA